MFRSRGAALFGALVSLLALAPDAHAGPVRWNYSGNVEAANGGPYAHFGVEEQHWFDPTTGAEGITPYQILGRIDATFSGSGAGRETIHAAGYDVTCLEAFPIDDPWALNRPTTFLVRVTILDEASGAAADLEYNASGTSNGLFLTGTGVISLTVASRIDEFVLGGNHFTVQTRFRESESAGHIELDIDAVHPNPEPGTLALAGIGLFGALGWRLRRR
jgi:hypothetical protein